MPCCSARCFACTMASNVQRYCGSCFCGVSRQAGCLVAMLCCVRACVCVHVCVHVCVCICVCICVCVCVRGRGIEAGYALACQDLVWKGIDDMSKCELGFVHALLHHILCHCSQHREREPEGGRGWQGRRSVGKDNHALTHRHTHNTHHHNGHDAATQRVETRSSRMPDGTKQPLSRQGFQLEPAGNGWSFCLGGENAKEEITTQDRHTV